MLIYLHHCFTVASCGFLDVPWGKVNTTDTLVGTVASITCFDGFVFVDDSTRQCTPALKWSGNVSICEGKLLIKH